jgi:hypothetical protein
VRTIAGGVLNTGAVAADGTALAWGDNTAGGLGDGTATDRRTPVPVCALHQVWPCARFLRHATAISLNVLQGLVLIRP